MDLFIDLMKAARARATGATQHTSGGDFVWNDSVGAWTRKTPQGGTRPLEKVSDAKKPVSSPEPSEKPQGGHQLEPCQFGGGMECIKHGGDGAKNHFQGYRHPKMNNPRSIHEVASHENRSWSGVGSGHSLIDATDEEVEKPFTVAKGVLQHMNQWKEKDFKAVNQLDQLAEIHTVHNSLSLLNRLVSYEKISDQKARPILNGLEEIGRRLSVYAAESILDKKPPGNKGVVKRLKQKAFQASISARVQIGPYNVDIHDDDKIEKMITDAVGDVDVGKFVDAWSVNDKNFMSIVTGISIVDNRIMFDGQVLSSAGDHVGVFDRNISKDKEGNIVVRHGLLDLEEEYQGGSESKYDWKIGTKMTRQAVKQYMKLGVNEITTHPAWIGKYVWARMGFDYINPEVGISFVKEHLPKFIAKEEKMSLPAAKKLVDQVAARPWDVACLTHKGRQIGKDFLLSEKYEGGGGLWSETEAHVIFDKSNPGFVHMLKYLGIKG